MRLLRKGWMLEKGQKPRRVVMDNHGHVFWPGCMGWKHPHEGATLKILPGAWEHTYWSSHGWWEKNWRIATWAWIYSVPHAT